MTSYFSNIAAFAAGAAPQSGEGLPAVLTPRPRTPFDDDAPDLSPDAGATADSPQPDRFHVSETETPSGAPRRMQDTTLEAQSEVVAPESSEIAMPAPSPAEATRQTTAAQATAPATPSVPEIPLDAPLSAAEPTVEPAVKQAEQPHPEIPIRTAQEQRSETDTGAPQIEAHLPQNTTRPEQEASDVSITEDMTLAMAVDAVSNLRPIQTETDAAEASAQPPATATRVSIGRIDLHFEAPPEPEQRFPAIPDFIAPSEPPAASGSTGFQGYSARRRGALR
jgi:hypothetical protein